VIEAYLGKAAADAGPAGGNDRKDRGGETQ
jgi:hypothetical protein